LLMRSGVRSFEERFAEAFEDVKRATDKSPNDAYCWVRGARILIHLDRGKEAEEAIRYAMRLNPFYPIQFLATRLRTRIATKRQSLSLMKSSGVNQSIYRGMCIWLARTVH
jgi:tetratricopeptide (TPR) repeat protein